MKTIWKYIEYVFECIWNPLQNNNENGIDDANAWMCGCVDVWMCKCVNV